MNKQEFLKKLEKGLSCLPKEDIEERLYFYNEMIDDRMEEGFSEEDAVKEIGSVDEIISQIIVETPLSKMAKENKKTMKVWEIALLILGSPIWLSILIAVFAIILSLYVTLWSVIVSCWAIFASLIASAIGLSISGTCFIIFENSLSGILSIALGLVCLGLSIFLFFGCKITTKGVLLFTKNIFSWIKKIFIRKAEVQ